MFSHENVEKITKKYPRSGFILYLLFNKLNKVKPQLVDETQASEHKDRAIILIPGRNNSTASFKFILQSNCFAKYKYYKFDYNTRNPIREILPTLLELIDSINMSSINLIGHSKGGLLAKHATLLSARKIDVLVTLATPHLGTVLARIPFLDRNKSHTDLHDFRISSDFNPGANNFINILPYWDPMIIPPKSLHSKYAFNIFSGTYGHDSLLYSEKSIEILYKIFNGV